MTAIVRMIVLAASLFVLAACAPDKTPTYRYRLTVEVETPEGLKTGSSVIEVRTSVAGKYAIPQPGQVSWRARGEAAAVDLPGGKTLFALLRSDNDSEWAQRVMFMLAPRHSGEDAFENTYRDMLGDRTLKTLPRNWPPVAHLPERSAYPLLVTFGDLANPASVARVDPDDLAASFGPGTRLKRITVQLTDDPVTTGIEKRLGWFSDLEKSGGNLIPMTKNARGRYEVAPGYDPALADIGLSYFSTEAYK